MVVEEVQAVMVVFTSKIMVQRGSIHQHLAAWGGGGGGGGKAGAYEGWIGPSDGANGGGISDELIGGAGGSKGSLGGGHGEFGTSSNYGGGGGGGGGNPANNTSEYGGTGGDGGGGEGTELGGGGNGGLGIRRDDSQYISSLTGHEFGHIGGSAGGGGGGGEGGRNTGGGGGAGANGDATFNVSYPSHPGRGGRGGSGIVIIVYELQPEPEPEPGREPGPEPEQEPELDYSIFDVSNCGEEEPYNWPNSTGRIQIEDILSYLTDQYRNAYDYLGRYVLLFRQDVEATFGAQQGSIDGYDGNWWYIYPRYGGIYPYWLDTEDPAVVEKIELILMIQCIQY